MSKMSKHDIADLVDRHKRVERRQGAPYGRYGISRVEEELQQTHGIPSQSLRNMGRVLKHFAPALRHASDSVEKQGQFNIAIARVLTHNDVNRAIRESEAQFNDAMRERDHWLNEEVLASN